MPQLHPINIVARQTGLSPHVIRVWERRYGAVAPERTKCNRRAYSEEAIARLLLLREATRAGHRIGQIARLTLVQLRNLVPSVETHGITSWPAGSRVAPEELINLGLRAIRELTPGKLEAVLNRASLEHGRLCFLHQVVVPLLQKIGDSWRDGGLRIAHEHIATTAIRTFLGTFSQPYSPQAFAPEVLVTTPTGQLHELGALLAAAVATHHGWNVTYLGPCLPADEIAGAAHQKGARAVALSIVYPEDDPNLPAEMTKLRTLLPGEVVLIVGGRAASAYRSTLQEIGAIHVESLHQLCAELDGLRRMPREKTNPAPPK